MSYAETNGLMNQNGSSVVSWTIILAYLFIVAINATFAMLSSDWAALNALVIVLVTGCVWYIV